MYILSNIVCLFKFAYIISKHQILIKTDNIKLSTLVKFTGYFITSIFYPIALFNRTTKPFGTRLAECLGELGPIYIKFGQTLSTRPDLIGSDIAESLKYLQDKLPPFDFSIVQKTVEESLDQPLDNIFANFDKKPVAAASIAQVHKAELVTGTKVAVKILRPGIHEKYNQDIRFLWFIAKIASILLRKSKRLKPQEVIKIFDRSMHHELNLKMEAAAASTLKDNFAKDNSIHIPQIYWEYTNSDMLTLEWIDGVSIYDQQKILKMGQSPDELAAKIAIIFFNMAYRDGFFHADLHPGNILVNKEGKIVLLDFGIIGILPKQDRLGIAEILYALLKRDYHRVAELHKKVGYVPADTSVEEFSQSLRSIAEPIIGLAIKDISIGKLLASLFKVTEEYGMETQPQLILLQKTIVVVEGIGQSLNPDINMWELAEPWIKKWAAKHLTPEAKILEFLKRLINDLASK